LGGGKTFKRSCPKSVKRHAKKCLKKAKSRSPDKKNILDGGTKPRCGALIGIHKVARKGEKVGFSGALSWDNSLSRESQNGGHCAGKDCGGQSFFKNTI